MAIEIVKQGETKFKATCLTCGCEFTYELEDLKEDLIAAKFVSCPCCGRDVKHSKLNNIIRIDPQFAFCDDKTKTSSNPCENCNFFQKYLMGNEVYVGDSPCQWCINSPFRITCDIKKGNSAL